MNRELHITKKRLKTAVDVNLTVFCAAGINQENNNDAR